MRRVDMFESISQIEFQSFFQYIRKPRKKKKAVLMIDIFPAGADMQVVCIRRTIQYLLVDCNQTGHCLLDSSEWQPKVELLKVAT